MIDEAEYKRLKVETCVKERIILHQADLIDRLKAQQPTEELVALRHRVEADAENEKEAQELFTSRKWRRLGPTHLRNCLDKLREMEIAILTLNGQLDCSVHLDQYKADYIRDMCREHHTNMRRAHRMIKRMLRLHPIPVAKDKPLAEKLAEDIQKFLHDTNLYDQTDFDASSTPAGQLDPQDPLDSDQPSGTKEPT